MDSLNNKKQYAPFFISATILVLLETNGYFPKSFFYILSANVTMLACSIWYLARGSIYYKNFLYYSILPLCLIISSSVYGILVSNFIFRQILILLIAVLNYISLRSLYFYFDKSEMYKAYLMNNFFSYAGFLIIFFSSSAIFGLVSYMNIEIWPLLFLLTFVVGLVLFQYYLIYEINKKRSFPFILLVCLSLLEISWAVSFLPLNYTVAGLTISVFYYMASGLTKYFLQENLNRSIIKFYLLFGSISIFILLLTSRWQ
jgi:hypothetical protein